MSFNQSAPNHNPQIPIGQNSSQPNSTANIPLFTPTYANLGVIQNQINNLISSISTLQSQLITTLDGLALPITSTDQTIAAAVAQTWPTQLGAAPSYVTYNYYNYLLGQNNSAATLIVNAFQAAMQGVGGNNAIDLLPILNILSNEINYINDFVTNNLSGGLNDSGEQRTAELFQDLLTTANTEVQNSQNIFQNQGAVLPQNETAQLSQGDFQNVQALFQVNLNKLNIQLNQDIQTLQTNFSFSAQTFYTKFLEPALQFRQNVSSQITPIYTGGIGALINSSVINTNENLATTLVDQQNRVNFLATQVNQIMSDIVNRDAYRNYIAQLSTEGAAVPSGASGQIIQAQDSPPALTFFQDAAINPTTITATPSFNADHQVLDNRLDLQCHPQYLLKSDYIPAISNITAKTIQEITSHDNSVNIKNPDGPITDISVLSPGIQELTSTNTAITITNPSGPDTSLTFGLSVIEEITSIDNSVIITNPNGPNTDLSITNNTLFPASGTINIPGNIPAFRLYQISDYKAYPPGVTFSDTLWQIADPISGNIVWNYTILFTLNIVARNIISPYDSVAWTMKGLAKGDGISTYSWVGGTPIFTTLAADAGASGWTPGIYLFNSPIPGIAFVLSNYIPNSINIEETLIIDAVQA